MSPCGIAETLLLSSGAESGLTLCFPADADYDHLYPFGFFYDYIPISCCIATIITFSICIMC